MLNAFAAGLGGLGLFFAGMYLLSDNLKQLAGSSFRASIAAWTRTPIAGLLWGVAAGALMQSTTAVTFIVISMIATGMLALRPALAIIVGCNIGTTLLVLVASLDIHVFVLLTLGVAGISFVSNRFAQVRAFATVAFGIGLVFLGLGMVRGAVAPLAQAPWLAEWIGGHQDALLPMLIGASLLTLLVQSTNSIALLAITLAEADLLSFAQTMMAIYGANVGGSLLVLLFSSPLEGRQRQAAMFQAAFNVVTALVLVVLFYLEAWAGLPLVRSLATALPGEPSLQLAYVHLLFNLIGAVLFMPLLGPCETLLTRAFPAPADEDDAQPRYLYDGAEAEPQSALALVDLEQARLAALLPRYCEAAATGASGQAQRTRQNFANLKRSIDEFLERLGHQNLSASRYEALAEAMNRQRLLEGLIETLEEMFAADQLGESSPGLVRLRSNVVEALHAVLLTLSDALSSHDELDRSLLRHATHDRSDLMRRLRSDYLAEDSNLATPQKMSLLSMINLLERAFWLLERLARGLPSPAAATAHAGA